MKHDIIVNNNKEITISSTTACEWSCVVVEGNILLSKYYGNFSESSSTTINLITYNTNEIFGTIGCTFKTKNYYCKKIVKINPISVDLFYVSNENVYLFGNGTKTYIYVNYGSIQQNNDDTTLSRISIIIGDKIIEYDGKKTDEIEIYENDILLYTINVQPYINDLQLFMIIITSKCDLPFTDVIQIKRNDDNKIIFINLKQGIVNELPSLLKISPKIVFLTNLNPTQKVNVTCLNKGLVSDYNIENINIGQIQLTNDVEKYLNGNNDISVIDNNGFDVNKIIDKKSTYFLVNSTDLIDNVDDEIDATKAYKIRVKSSKNENLYQDLEIFYDNIVDPNNYITIKSISNVKAFVNGDNIQESVNGKIEFKYDESIQMSSLTLLFIPKDTYNGNSYNGKTNYVIAEYDEKENIIFAIDSMPTKWNIFQQSDYVKEVKNGNDLNIALEKEIPVDGKTTVVLQNNLGMKFTIFIESEGDVIKYDDYLFGFGENNSDITLSTTIDSNNNSRTILQSKINNNVIIYRTQTITFETSATNINLDTIFYNNIDNNITKTISSHTFNILYDSNIGKKYINYGSISLKNSIKEIKDNNIYYINEIDNTLTITIDIPEETTNIPWKIISENGGVKYDVYYDGNKLQKNVYYYPNDENTNIIYCLTLPNNYEENTIYFIPKNVITTSNEISTIILQQYESNKEVYLYLSANSNTLNDSSVNKYGSTYSLTNMLKIDNDSISSAITNQNKSQITIFNDENKNIYYASYNKINNFTIVDNENVNFYIAKEGDFVPSDINTLSSENASLKFYFANTAGNTGYTIYSDTPAFRDGAYTWDVSDNIINFKSGDTIINQMIIENYTIGSVIGDNNKIGYVIDYLVWLENIDNDSPYYYNKCQIIFDYSKIKVDNIIYNVITNNNVKYIEDECQYQVINKVIDISNKKYILDNNNSFFNPIDKIKYNAYNENNEWYIDLFTKTFDISYDENCFYITNNNEKILFNDFNFEFNDIKYYPSLSVNLNGLQIEVLESIDGNENEKEKYIILNNNKYVAYQLDNKNIIAFNPNFNIGISGNVITFNNDYYIDILYEESYDYVIIDFEKYILQNNSIIYDGKKYPQTLHDGEKYIIINNKGYQVETSPLTYYCIINNDKYIFTFGQFSGNTLNVKNINEINDNEYFKVEEVVNETLSYYLDFNDLLSSNIISAKYNDCDLSKSYLDLNGKKYITKKEFYLFINEKNVHDVSYDEYVTIPDIISGVSSVFSITFNDDTEIIINNNETSRFTSGNTFSRNIDKNLIITINDYSDIKFNNKCFIQFKNDCNITFNNKDIKVFKGETFIINKDVNLIFKDITTIKISYNSSNEYDFYVFNNILEINNEIYCPTIIDNEYIITYDNNDYYIIDGTVKINENVFSIDEKSIFYKIFSDGSVTHEKYSITVNHFNGHDYVDLGLPSGTLWATKVVGAESESDYGLYFAWGGTEGATKEQVESGEFTFGTSGNMKPYFDSSTFEYTKYNATDGKVVLDLEDDAAHVHMGGDWHMPTKEQWEELTANTTSTWITKNGVNGRLFTSMINGESVFVPAFGRANDDKTNNVGSNGYVWSSSVYEGNLNNACNLHLHSSNIGISNDYRFNGQTILAVVEYNESTTEDYIYIQEQELKSLSSNDYQNITFTLHLPYYDNNQWVIKECNISNFQTYNTENLTYHRASFNYPENNNKNIENGKFKIKLNSYNIYSGTTLTLNKTTIDDVDTNFIISGNSDITYSFWDYYENKFIKKIKKKEVSDIPLSFNKTITFDNVKTKIEVDKYVKINNQFCEISENTINYNGTNYPISDNLVNVTRQIPIEYISSKKKPYCIYDIDSFLKHEMIIYDPYISQNNIRMLNVKNEFNFNHQENIIIETETNNNKMYGHYLITFKVNDDNNNNNDNIHNGYEYVDLGLPSGTLWATSPIMSNGDVLYFAWGETSGYTETQINNKEKKFNYEGYDLKYPEYDNDENYIHKYSRYWWWDKSKQGDKKRKLVLEDDAAHVYMGGDWHMPTNEQFEELITFTEVSEYNNYQVILKSTINNNTITFLKYGYVYYNENNIIVEDYYYYGCELYNISNTPSYNYTSSSCLNFIKNKKKAQISFKSRTEGLPIYGVIG